MLNEVNMDFTGFILQPAIKAAYRRLFNDDVEMKNLDNWDKLEAYNPDMFTGMYQFYCTAK